MQENAYLATQPLCVVGPSHHAPVVHRIAIAPVRERERETELLVKSTGRKGNQDVREGVTWGKKGRKRGEKREVEFEGGEWREGD